MLRTLAVAAIELRTMTRGGWALAGLLLLPVFFFALVSLSMSTLTHSASQPVRVGFVQGMSRESESLLGRGVAAGCVSPVEFSAQSELVNALLTDRIAFGVLADPGKGAEQAELLRGRYVGPRDLANLNACVISVLAERRAADVVAQGMGAFGPLMTAADADAGQEKNVPALTSRGVIEYLMNDDAIVLYQQFSGWLVFGLMLVAFPIVSAIGYERSSGIDVRLKTLGLPNWQRFAGKMIAYFAVNLLQFVFLFVAWQTWTPLLTGVAAASVNPNWMYLMVSVVLTSATVSVWAMCLALRGQAYLHTPTLISGVIVALALLAGVMVPKSVMPVSFRHLTEYAPMSLSVDAIFQTLLPTVFNEPPYGCWLGTFVLIILGIFVLYRSKF